MKLHEIVTKPVDEPMNILSKTQAGEHPKTVRKSGKKLLRKLKRKGDVPMWFKKQAD